MSNEIYNTNQVKLFRKHDVGAVLISTKGQIVLPVAVRTALGLKPGMRVNVKVNGKNALIAPAPEKRTVSLQQIQSLLQYEGPTVPVSAMRVTDCNEATKHN